MKKIILVLSIISLSAHAENRYLGRLSNNPYDQNSISNPYGKYGNPYDINSINSPYGKYGSRYSNTSPNNPYATNPPVLIQDRNGNINIYSDE